MMGSVRVDRTEEGAVTSLAPLTGDFDEFVRGTRDGLVRYTYLLCGSRPLAEDLVHDVLARLYPRWSDLIGRLDDILPYVRRSLTNEYLSWRRRWSTRMIHSVDDAVLTANASAVDGRPDDVDSGLWDLLQSLPRRQRAAVVLRYYQDLSDAEIADILGCGVGAVRSNISRALSRLRTSDEAQRIRRESRP